MTETLFLGVDVGTGSARAGLFTAEGRRVGRSEYEIRTWRTIPDHVEQSSDDIWRAVCAAVRDSLEQAGASADQVAGVGFDATCSLAAVDAAGRPVGVSLDGGDERNVVVWMDHRAVDDAREINATGHPVLDFVGGRISPEMQTPKLRWLKRELPECWERTRLWLDLPDYLTWRATGSEDRSLCTTVCKWTYLGHERRWDPSYFQTVGLGDLADDGFQRIGTRVRVPGEPIGGLSAAAAAELGLAPDTPVAAALIDAHAGAMGTLGVTGVDVPLSARMAVIAGTSACHLLVTPEQRSVPGVWGPYFEALTPGGWLLEAGLSASGAFLDHALASHPAARDIDDVLVHAEQHLQVCLERGATIEGLSDGLHLQPNVLGNRAPLADPTLRGGVAGWALRTDPDDLVRWYLAALQALACATRHIVQACRESGCTIDMLVASGGSAASERWCQIHADALGMPVVVPAEADGVLLGSAMLGAVAAGRYNNPADAMTAMTGPGRIVRPEAAARGFHDRKYAVYRRMIEDQMTYDQMMRNSDEPAIRG